MFSLRAVIILSLTTLTFAADCEDSNPLPNQECVEYYLDTGCGVQLGRYKPTCEGNCFVYDFESLNIKGSGYTGTDCTAYSDSNCQNQIQNTGNILDASGTCFDTPGAKSMKCYFDC